MNNVNPRLPKSAGYAIQLALGPQGSGLLVAINKWLSTNGIEWTVTRLKALRTAALQLRAGNHEITRQIYRENSIAYRKDCLLPRGPYHHVFTLFLQAERPVALRRLETVLRVYTALRLQDVSLKQAEKAQKAINAPYQGTDVGLSEMTDYVSAWVEGILLPDIHTNRALVRSDGSPRLRRPSLERLKAFTSTHKGSVRAPKDLAATPYGRACLSIMTSTVWPTAFRGYTLDGETYTGGVYSSDVFEFIRSRVWAEGTDNDYAGHISLIQEAGAKARVVAVPSALLQWGFEPLHSWLDKVIRTLPRSCVHDQNKGAYVLSRLLQADKTVWSFDLSSATDRFPRSVQLKLLKDLKLGSYAEALDEIACEDWLVSSGPFKGEKWKYGVGQPMGLYASFPLFSLTHYALLGCIAWDLGWKHDDAPFLLLGDDVLVWDADLALEYERILRSCGVEISAQKTVKSSRVAEFAGFVGYRTNKSAAVFRPYKHCDRDFIHNPLNLIFSLGSAMGRQGSKYWKEKVKIFQLTRSWRNPDLTPLIPNQDEPEGVNPRVLDTYRLTNLLEVCELLTGTTINTWSGDRYEINDLEDFADTLLGKERSQYDSWDELVGEKLPDQLLQTPVVDEKSHPTHSMTKKLSEDPLMSEFQHQELTRHEAEPVDDHTRHCYRDDHIWVTANLSSADLATCTDCYICGRKSCALGIPGKPSSQ